MGDFTKPQQKYAGSGENDNMIIAVIFNLVNATFLKFSCILIGFVSTQIFNFKQTTILQIYLKFSKIQV